MQPLPSTIPKAPDKNDTVPSTEFLQLVSILKKNTSVMKQSKCKEADPKHAFQIIQGWYSQFANGQISSTRLAGYVRAVYSVNEMGVVPPTSAYVRQILKCVRDRGEFYKVFEIIAYLAKVRGSTFLSGGGTFSVIETIRKTMRYLFGVDYYHLIRWQPSYSVVSQTKESTSLELMAHREALIVHSPDKPKTHRPRVIRRYRKVFMRVH